MKRPWIALMAVATLAPLVQCKDGTAPEPEPPAPVSLLLSPDSISLHVGQTLQMHLLVLDSAGDPLDLAQQATWSSTDTSVIAVSSSGLATGHSYGTAVITAHLDTLHASAYLRVLIPVADVMLSPYVVMLVPGGTLRLTAELTGVDGSTISDRDVAWNHQGSVSITPSGMMKGLQVGRDSITAIGDGIASWNYVIATVTQPAFVRIVSGEWSTHTCAIAADGRAFCWGDNAWGTLGTGTFGDSVQAGRIGSPTGGLAYPTGVIDLTSVVSIAAGSGMTCAVESDFGHPYCWGFNGESQTGVDGTDAINTPASLRTSRRATEIVTGSEWGCFLATDSLPYCWGGNTTGTVIPLPAMGGRKYVTIAGGYNTLCGIGTDSLAYCGNPLQNHAILSPTIKFTVLSVGYLHACGIATDSTAYCWGANTSGQLGNGTPGGSTPTPVSGNMKFVDIAAGDLATCGIVAPSSAAYCWGDKRNGLLGADTTGFSSVPINVGGQLAFVAVTIGDYHACGLSVTGKAYCWGDNRFGQLGDGTTTKRFAPTFVVGQQP